MTPWEIASMYTDAFLKDISKLNIQKPNVICKASEHIKEMLEIVYKLYDDGYAYETSDGIYFDISKFPDYGKLSNIDLDGQIAGARVAVNMEKKHPADFALWKKAPKEHIMQWESRWGMGYPGWHIECSAMSRKYLGDQFDFMTGGVDHIPYIMRMKLPNLILLLKNRLLNAGCIVNFCKLTTVRCLKE